MCRRVEYGKASETRIHQGGDGNHWITVELASPNKNLLAIGALVKATAGAMVQTEEVHSGGSYLSSNDLRVHFGLGQSTSVEQLEVHWPSGNLEKFIVPGTDRIVTLTEGTGNR